MKTIPASIALCAVIIFCASPACASGVDFFDHDSDNYSNQDKSGKGDDGDFKSGGYSPADFSKYGDSKHHDDEGNKDGDKYGKGKGSDIPPPLCSVADPGHDGKWDNSHGDKDKGGKDKWGYSGKGDDGGGKDKWGRGYYKEICDKGGRGDPGGHKHGCDPGNPAPLPGSLPMFIAALALLILRNRTRRLSS